MYLQSNRLAKFLRYCLVSCAIIIASDGSIAQTTLSVHFNKGWNLFSLPVALADRTSGALFPQARASEFFGYNPGGGYFVEDTLVYGRGYQVKMLSDTVLSFTGGNVTLDTVQLASGWNVIGSISYPLSIQLIHADTNVVKGSEYWSLDQGYDLAGTILPGHGYWVYAQANGSLVLDADTCFQIDAPQFTRPPTPNSNSVLVATIGTAFSFSVAASDDGGNPLALSSSPLPPGALMTPALPAFGNPVASTFQWTPEMSDTGAHRVMFTTTNGCGLTAMRTFTILVEGRRNFAVPLRVSGPGGAVDTVYFGETYNATSCLDSQLGELNLPPANPVFDVRLKQIPSSCANQSAKIDFRPFGSAAQRDTFKVITTSGESGGLQYSWPDMNPYYTGSVTLRDLGDATSIDMKSINSYATSGTNSTLLVIAEHPTTSGVILQSPSNGATNLPVDPILNWYYAPGAQSYRLQVAYDSNYTDLAFDDSTIVSSSFQVPALPSGLSYYWHVGVKTTGGFGGWSDTWKFGTTTPTDEYRSDTSTVFLAHFDEGTGSIAHDASGYGNNGTCIGTTIVDGRFEKARLLNGVGEYIDLPESPSLTTFADKISIEAWLYLASYPNPGAGNHIVSTGNQNNYDFSVMSDGHLGAHLYLSTGPGEMVGKDSVPLNTWTHVAMTYDGSIVKFFIKGILDSSFARNGTIGGASQPNNIAVGAYLYNGSFTQFYHGIIDELRISSIARAPEDFNLLLPPKNLLTHGGINSVRLSWQNGGGQAPFMRYRIYRGVDSNLVVLVDSTTAEWYVDSSVSVGVEYFYRIAAVDSTRFESARSYAQSARPLLPALAGEYAPDSSTVALYHFDEISGSTVLDNSGNGHDGMASGTTIVGGLLGSGRSYNHPSVEYISVPAIDTSLKPTKALTVECWIKPAYQNYGLIGGQTPVLISTTGIGPNAPDGYELGMFPISVVTPTPFAFYFAVKTNAGPAVAVSSTLYDSLHWYHVAGVYRNDGVNSIALIYVNGNREDSVFLPNCAIEYALSSDTLYVGNQAARLDNYRQFWGLLDEVRISNKAREPWEFKFNSSIHGEVFNDLAGDGKKRNGSPRISDWIIRLSGARIDSAKTDTAGRYAFSDLPPGTYSVTEVPQSRWVQTMPASPSYIAVLSAAADASGLDFGNFRVPKGDVNSGWNLISVPLKVTDHRELSLYPSATSAAYGYKKSYVVEDTLESGRGYWLKFAAKDSISYGGLPKLCDTIRLTMGWNMIGSLSLPASVSAIWSNPPGMNIGNFFGYDGSYVITDTLQPGRGYWVKAQQDGDIILTATTAESAEVNPHAGIRIVPTGELPPSPPIEGSSAKELVPDQYMLREAYPNPFNPATTIRYQLPLESQVSIRIFNLLGQEVARLVDGIERAGYRTVAWNASENASGVYFCRFEATSLLGPESTFRQVRKIVLLR